MTMKQIALALVRLHPPAWRTRYADEVSALVEQSPANLKAVADLARSGAGEWTCAAWRGVVIEPGRWPHPGKLSVLWCLTVLSYYVGLFMAQVGHAICVAGVVLSYGMPERALDVLVGRIDGIYGPFPSLTLGMVLYVLVAMYFYFALPAVVVIAAARWSGTGYRFPMLTRAAVACAFSITAIGLRSDTQVFAGTLLAGWVLASAFFPRRPSIGPGADSIPMVHT